MKKIFKIKISEGSVNVLCIMQMSFKERCNRSFKCMIDFCVKVERIADELLNKRAYER